MRRGNNFYFVINNLLFSILMTCVLNVQGQSISFNQSALNFNEFEEISSGTSLQFGPDERLYVAQLKGEIKIYTILKNGANEYEVVGEETLLNVKNIPNYDDNGKLAFDKRDSRQVTGLTVAGTSSNPVLYISSSDPKWGGPSGDKLLDTNSGTITRITWTGSFWESIDLVRGLPRSEENHSTNGLELTHINGKPYLLVASGGLTNAGAPSKNFTYITEYALSAAILSVDLEAIEDMPTQIDDHSGRPFKYDIPTLDDPSRANVNGIYDPNDPGYDGGDVNDPFGGNDGLNMGMVTEDGPVQIFSPGFRNSYDLVVTETNRLYVTDNGANINWGGLPINEGNSLLVSNNYQASEPGASPLNPSVSGEFVDNQDHLLMVANDLDSYEVGSFYGGHPAPIRANPGQTYVKGSAFPFEPGGAGLYTKFMGDDNNYANQAPVFTPTDRFRTVILQPIAPGQHGFDDYAGNSLPANWPPVPLSMKDTRGADFIAPTLANTNGPQPEIITVLPNNSNGLDEYKASNFDGALKGALIAGKNGGDLHLVHLNADGSLKEVTFNKWNLNGGNALGITCNADGDIFPGTVWVATFDNRIMVLTPADDVFCIDIDDLEFDPGADDDHDGYTNQDELDNDTDYCSGGSIPADYDEDLVSNLNDLDDDGDGIPDEEDPFQIGNPSDLPIENELFTNQADPLGREYGYLGLGLTGLMNNADPNPNWLNWLDKGNESPGPPDIYGGTAGAIQVSMTGGTANGSANNQEKGFQFGVNVGEETGRFTITSGLIGLSSPGQLYDYNGPGEVGIQIGDGTQSNFIKLVFTSSGITAAQEINNQEDQTPLFIPISETDRPGTNTLIQLSFEVNPYTGTVEPFYRYDEEEPVSLGMITATGKIKEAIQNINFPLAIGIYGSSHNEIKSFIGVWNYFGVSGEKPFILRNLRKVERLMNDPDLTINLQEYFGDNNGSNNLAFSVSKNTNSLIGANIEENVLRLSFPNDEVTADITVRATDADGYFVEQTIHVLVQQDIEILLRINAGGNLLEDEVGDIDWMANSVTGAFVSEAYSVNTGKNSSQSFDANGRHISIPDYISNQLYTKIFSKERYGQDPKMEYKIPLPDGKYLVNLYLGNGFEGTSTLLKRVFDIEIEGELVETQFDLIEEFGHKVGGMKQYEITLADGELNIGFIKQVENPLVNGIEILGKPIQYPIQFSPIANQFNFSGHQLDGSMFVEASGGNGNLSYAAEGFPSGVYLEPTNGTIYGAIGQDALSNSPYLITIIIDDEDDVSSDAVSFNFTWTISPPLLEQKWTLKGESTNYTGRHENAFVQAGNKFYLLGGRESAKTIDIYEYEKDEWSTLPEINPMPFNHFQAVEYEGLIWVIGAFKTNDYPEELPADHIWMFDPSDDKWIQGPEIPESRKRGSTGLVQYNGKFYMVGGNTQGHNGGYVNYFDEFDPETGKWTVLDDAPIARDHFFATTIGSRMYVVSGRQSGGSGGVFAPVIPQVDIYDFNSKSWSTLPADKNIPTPRAGAIVNNYLDKLIVAGGEVPDQTQALAKTEMFDPLTQEWNELGALNGARHGSQGIVSGKGLYVLGGSPNRGGGNQKNMEYFGFDQPEGDAIVPSQLKGPEALLVRKGEPKKFQIAVKEGNTGVWIKSMKLKGEGAEAFNVISGSLKEMVFWPLGHVEELEIDYVGDELKADIQLEISYGDNKVHWIEILGDGDYQEIAVYYNSGSLNNVDYEGNNYLGDRKHWDIVSVGESFTNTALSTVLLYQSERFGEYLNYRVPVPNGNYTVVTHHAETWFGKPGGGNEGPGKRIFDILIEGKVVKADLDFYVENENDPFDLTFENIEVVDGELNLDLIAAVNNASISGFSIVNEGELGRLPVADAHLAVNAGSNDSVDYLEETFEGENGSGVSFTSSGVYSINSTDPELFLTERFGTDFTYSVPVKNGTYTVKTYHNELWYGKSGPAGGAGKRIYSIYLEGELVKNNFDIFVENNNEPTALTFENVDVTDGILQIRLKASTNNASLTGFSIFTLRDSAPLPQANIQSNVSSGSSPLTVEFSGTNSFGSNLSFGWDFGDGGISNELSPVHLFQSPGNYLVALTVRDEYGMVDTEQVNILVSDDGSNPKFEYFVNTGSNKTVGFEGDEFIGESSSSSTFTNSGTYSIGPNGDPELFLTERFGKNFTYSIPLPNGIYSVKTYHNELWYGKKGPAGSPGMRVYHILMEGNQVKSNFDIFVENANHPTVLTFQDIEVTDGELDIDLVATNNNASISGISVKSVSVSEEMPEALLQAHTMEGESPLEVQFKGSNSTGAGLLDFRWDFGDGTTSEQMDPTHIFTSPGVYVVSLRVMDKFENADTDAITITVLEEATEWMLFLNTGTSENIEFNGNMHLGDVPFIDYYNSSSTFNYTSGIPEVLFQTERFASNLQYSIPVENGQYRVKTYHTELWFGKWGPSAKAGNRIFDIILEGNLVRDDFDIFVESNNQPIELVFENIEVTDGVMNLNFEASVNKANVTGIILEKISKTTSGKENLRLMIHEEAGLVEVPQDTFPEVHLYPNPTSQNAYLRIEEDIVLDWITVHDLSGRRVMELNVMKAPKQEYTLPVNGLGQGVYMITLITREGERKQLRLIIEK
ncbi:MAG: malectin domain-containing carbohydrate-binding protein [Cyclobacteriaceae bacterium]